MENVNYPALMVLMSVFIVLALIAIVILVKYLVVAKDVKRTIQKEAKRNDQKVFDSEKRAADLLARTDEQINHNEQLLTELKVLRDEAAQLLKEMKQTGNVVEVKELTKEEADQKMELMYLETPSGFHIGLDFTFIDQVSDFKILLPTGEVIDTATIDPDGE